ncbi:MAG: hypothetical protein KDD43_06270, partial [Bdellovibrionales bacterium]|nr:hypothetical protein [Bdellovibrionales bacterium]
MITARTLLIASLTLAQSFPVYAETAASGLPVANVTPLAGLGGGGTFVGNAGQYDINAVTQDNSRIAGDLIKQATDIQNIDREYLKSVVDRLNSQLQNLARLQKQFTELSQKSQVQSYIPLEDFLKLVNEINEASQILENDILTLASISRESLPSYNPLEIGNLKVSVSTVGNINFAPLMAKVDAQRVGILTAMNNTQFPNMQSRLGQAVAVTQSALTPNLSGIRILTEEEMQEKIDLVSLKLTWSKKTKQYANDMASIAVTQILNFIQDYGTGEWLRWRSDNDSTAREAAFGQISQAFFMRSYLRRKYGVRLGAIQTVDYDKKLANLEDLTYQPMLQALKSLRREVAMTQADVARAFENARNFVELYDKKLTPTFKSGEEILSDPVKFDVNTGKLKEYASQNTGVMVRANALINTITGQDAAAEALLMMMRLILSDAMEEMFLYVNDSAGMANYHTAKYRSTDGLKVAYNDRVCSFDTYLPEVAVKQVCKGKAAKPPQITNGASGPEVFFKLL